MFLPQCRANGYSLRWYSYQEALKDALDNANNNLTFVQSGPCAFDTPY